jgi:hypothetical protein
MAFSFRSLAVTALPLALLAGLLWIMSGRQPEPGSTVAPVPSPAWLPMDLAGAESLDAIPGWDVRRGSYRLTETGGRKVLELIPEPIVEGKVLCTRQMWGGGGVRARMRGDRSRRAWPRFSVGLHQERELHLRAFPEDRKLQLVVCDADLTHEEVLASASLPEWTAGPMEWTWLELVVTAQSNGESLCEGRLWVDGQLRPDSAPLILRTRLGTGGFRAALQGAPFALKPIQLDAAETLLPPLAGTGFR